MDHLKKILTELLETRKNYSKELSALPPGALLYQKNHGSDQFLYSTGSGGRRQRRGITNNRQMLAKLARKAFLRETLRILDHNIACLQAAQDGWQDYDPQKVIGILQGPYQRLPEEYFFDRNQLTIDLHLDEEARARAARHRDWGERPFTQSTYKPEEKTHTTSRGLKVRSKSEVAIAEMLYRYGVPFRYEQVLWTDNSDFAPDFTFEDGNWNPFYLEHAGMLDDPEYADRHIRKLWRYHSEGITMGKELLVTWDRDGTLNMPTVEAIILNEIIPRL